ncbi:hypothetical protein HZA39_01240, partial [Candidatus Peregrinibacteria bacterium]|nr:hypothetical protein [Candidatus Peregrinibacteria bacterium]
MSKQVCCWRSKKTPSGLSKFAVILGVVAVLALSVPVGVYLQAHVLGPFLAQNDFTCTDSDGGSDYFIKGTAKESASPEMDYIDQCGPGSSQIPSGHELIE